MMFTLRVFKRINYRLSMKSLSRKSVFRVGHDMIILKTLLAFTIVKKKRVLVIMGEKYVFESVKIRKTGDKFKRPLKIINFIIL